MARACGWRADVLRNLTVAATQFALVCTIACAALVVDSLNARIATAQAQAQVPASAGPRTIVGVVTDTLGAPVANADVSIRSIDRTTRTDANGVFRFINIAPGTYRISARAVGYVSPASEIKVGAEGVRVVIQMIRFATTLASRVTIASRGGLSGVIADTAMRALGNVSVVAVGSRETTVTDSAGAFFMPLKPGSYMLRLERDGYDRQIVGVNIPKDEGREIAAWMKPRTGASNNNEAQALFDLNSRMIRTTKASSEFLTRDQLAESGVEGLAGALQKYAQGPISGGCEVSEATNPSPFFKLSIGSLAVADVEYVEAYKPTQGVGSGRVRGPTSINAMARGSNANTSAPRLGGGSCGGLSIIVWLRK